MNERNCEVCRSADYTSIASYSPPEWPLVSCRACGFVYLRIVPDFGDLEENFAWEKTFEAEAGNRVKRLDGKLDVLTRWRLKAGKLVDQGNQDAALGKSGKVLDIGCGGGCRVPAGPTPFGIEISKALAEQAAPSFEQRGGSVYWGAAVDGLDAFADEQFDAILMRSYLEHESMPRAVLTKSYACLKRGGRVMLRLPNYGSPNRLIMGRRWCGFRFPDHVNYFTGRSLKALAEKIGFRYGRLNALSIFDDNLQVVLTKP